MALDAVFCGNGSLLIQCAGAFQDAGGIVRSIVTQDARVEEAAGALALPVRRAWEAQAPESVDYLFSVANLRVLPGRVLAQAGRMAINFHDGPLPRFAGLNVPSWALMEGEATHAVTWHEMTEAVDAGRVLAERRFDILPTDTAFTLNARCYDAGLEAFRGLLPGLLAGTLAGREQAGERHWYAGSKRPEQLGLLDFAAPSVELDRLVRALEFGGRANPLALPKVWTGEEVVVVRRLTMGEATGEGPGTVLRAEGDVLAVAAGDRVVELSGLSDLSGRAVEAGRFASLVGRRLPPVKALDPETLRAVGKAERGWEEALRSADPALPPHPGRDVGDRGASSVALPAVPGSVLLAGFLAWVAGLTGKMTLTVADRRGAGHPALSDLRPMSVGMHRGETVGALTARVAGLLAGVRDAAPMACDLPLRLETPEARDRALGASRVVFAEGGSDEEVLGDAEVALALAPPRLVVRRGRYDEGVLRRIGEQLSEYLRAFAVANADRAVESLPLSGVGFTGSVEDPSMADPLVHEAIAEQARLRPEAPALEAGAVSLSRGELDAAAGRLAGALAARGAGPGRVVGICLERGADLVVAMLAVLRTGAAYLPLDPDYPADRIAFMVDDAGAEMIVASESAAARHGLDPARVVGPEAHGDAVLAKGAGPDDLAYLIYTSGSTGRPKGVMVPHRAVANFLRGMDAVVPIAEESRLLAVTSVSFDIAVLEILWTLARGATVVLQVDAAGAARPDLSLFYFASESSGSGHDVYRLLIEGAKFADANGFEAVWTPERHFHAFGGLYPNPAVSLAALSTITTTVKLRAGSVVAPLHHPVRLAEDWALVDNLSNGRAGLAFASGWQPNDFLLRPESFSARKAVMLDTLGVVRRLWAGERVAFPGHDGVPVEVEIHPKPVQATLPVWLTAAGNPETFVEAGRLGCGVLTHLLGQSFEEVSRKVAAYHAAWREAGHAGRGHVVLMLHTFIGESEEEVLRLAQGPMKAYMKSAVDLIRRASWSFPTIVQRAEAEGLTPAAMFEREALSAEDLDQLLEHAFARYHRRAGLFGTPDSAAEVVRQAAEAGADEIGCLIDFGIDSEVVLANLPNIRALMDGLERRGGATRHASVAEDVLEKRITHLQCTPSLASYLAADAQGHAALARLEVLMVGGEPLLPELARTLREGCGGRLLNMYGPTETTVWSTVARLDEVGERVPLGEPIRNTLLSVRSPDGRTLPDLVPGELWIGGAGVTAGYWRRPELTAERFVTTPEGRFYRTGDLVRRTGEGALEFLGRIDNQVKVRGHRIELGEIEAALGAQPSVRQVVVTARDFAPGDTRLIGFVTGLSEKPDPAMLLTALARTLPAAMVPSQIVALDRMPLLPNGKVDRRALVPPAPVVERAAVAEALDEVQGKVEGVWKRVLNLEAMSLDDNFFDLGGHSLLVVQVQRQLREMFGAEISITDVFRFPTVRSLARHIGGLGGAEPSPASRGAARGAMRRMRMGRDGAQRQPYEDA